MVKLILTALFHTHNLFHVRNQLAFKIITFL